MSLSWRGAAALAVLTAAAVTAAQLGFVAPAAAAPGPPPGSIASMGDSISRGFNACGWYVDCPSRSFSTGTDTGVNSHYLRIKAVNAAINGHNYNDAASGAKVADMPGQAASAVSQGAAYVTILIGANDACTSSESSMTSVAAFRASLDSALGALKAGLPGAKVLLISIPDLKRLWQVGSGSASARTIWSVFGVCQSMLANPSSTAAADVARRDRVRQRVVDFNGQLAAACVAYGANCKYDGGAVFGYQFTLSQVSTWDYFHPNAAGQAALASISYAAGFGW
ncbi:SGNH/GDSL hydrolase family protein [Dactylosporangium vinaceum]|uniref:SGNH/GDSL hydrolase family protein n=1 Tax=Dactylosporangium vinaceum TaxID=53362 RepID=A0ABV5MIM3_9ACTN|nr:SGNH/GDSL hydrolase family protein [Dactylosporangium vinaceum]UAB93824.1 SGNH/GDSL hydrolase family protein [Dactylosporangium vinaceum]